MEKGDVGHVLVWSVYELPIKNEETSRVTDSQLKRHVNRLSKKFKYCYVPSPATNIHIN